MVLLLDDEGRWCWRPMDRAEVPKSEANTRVTVPCAVVLVELHEGCGGWRMGRTRTRGVRAQTGEMVRHTLGTDGGAGDTRRIDKTTCLAG